jgi:transposase
VQLTSYARSRSLPRSLSERARIILSSAEGEANSSIAARLKLSKATVGKWRVRFIERRIAGLYDDVRPGAPRSIDDERIAQLINTTLHTKPADGSTHWSVRTVAAETRISKSSVQRYFQLFGPQPHRTEGFKLSSDPFFGERQTRDATDVEPACNLCWRPAAYLARRPSCLALVGDLALDALDELGVQRHALQDPAQFGLVAGELLQHGLVDLRLLLVAARKVGQLLLHRVRPLGQVRVAHHLGLALRIGERLGVLGL